MRARSLLNSVVTCLVAAMASTACGGVSGAVALDDGLEIVAPDPLDVVRAPLELRWEGDVADGSAFAVFIDRRPMAPGQSLNEAFEDACEDIPRCPDEAFLRARGVYVTDEEELSVPLLMPRGGVDGASDLDVHRATIVLVDRDGVRQGEQFWSTEFRVQR